MTNSNEANPTPLKCPQCSASLPFSLAGYVVCQYCGTSLVYHQTTPRPDAREEQAVRGIRLKQFTYTDAQGTGLELFRMLVTVGWKDQGGCRAAGCD